MKQIIPFSPANYWFIIISQCGVSGNPICVAYKSTMHFVTSGILLVCIVGLVSEQQMKKWRLISLEFGFAWLVLCVLPWNGHQVSRENCSLFFFFFASLPLKHPSLQIASCFSKLAATNNAAGTDGPMQVPSATPGGHFMHLSRKASCSSACWKVLNTQCPPPGVVAQKFEFPCS